MNFQQQVPLITLQHAAQMARNTCIEHSTQETPAVEAKRIGGVWAVLDVIESDSAVQQTGMIGWDYLTGRIARALAICRDNGDTHEEYGVMTLATCLGHLNALQEGAGR